MNNLEEIPFDQHKYSVHEHLALEYRLIILRRKSLLFKILSKAKKDSKFDDYLNTYSTSILKFEYDMKQTYVTDLYHGQTAAL